MPLHHSHIVTMQNRRLRREHQEYQDALKDGDFPPAIFWIAAAAVMFLLCTPF